MYLLAGQGPGQFIAAMQINSDEILLKERIPSDFGGDLVQLTFNRPEALNSFSRALMQDLAKAITGIRNDPDARVLILTGVGRSFSTGADLKERAGFSPAEVKEFLHSTGRLFREIEALPIPVIAAINGYALGGGLELALCCDLRIASADAMIGLTETSLGIIPGAGGTQRLTRVLGLSRAKELIYTARKVTAARALELGLVNQICESERLRERTLELAREISRNAPIALTQAKFAIDRGFDTDLETGLQLERKAYEITIPTKDRLEALAAFKEKRPPAFKGE